jgi:hypothetical protein
MAAMVKSVEFIEVSQAGTTSAIDLTKGQNYENCIPFMTLHGCGDYMDSHLQDVYFNGTTISGVINFTRDELRSCTMHIKCYVVEFDPAEVKVQQGSFSALGTTTTAYAPGESFTQGKTAMVHYWKSSSGTQAWDIHLVRGRVNDDDTVDMYRNQAGGTVSGHYFIFEDISAGNDHFIVDHQDVSFTGTSSNRVIPAAQQDPTRTFIIGSIAAEDGNTGYNGRQTARIYPYFKGFTRCDRHSSSGGLRIWWSVQHVTFQDQTRVYVPFQHYSSFGTGATTTTNSWSRACDTNLSTIIATVPMGICRGGYDNVTQIDSLWCSMKITSSTGAAFERNSTGGTYSSYWGYSIVDWGGALVLTGSNPTPIDPDISPVKSVENFRITVSAYLATQDLSKGQEAGNCAVFASQRCSGGGTEIKEHLHDVWIREPGIVCAHRTDGTGDGIVDVSVVEFYPDQVKVQQGNFNMWSTGNPEITSTLASGVANIDNAFVLAKWESNDATWWSRNSIRVRFIDEDTIGFYRNDVGNIVAGTYFVVEDLQATFFKVFHSTGSFTGTSRSVYNYEQNAYAAYYQALPIASFASSQNNYYVHYSACRTYQVGNGAKTVVQKSTTNGTIWVAHQYVRFLDARDHIHSYASTMGTSTTVLTTGLRSLYLDHKDLSVSLYNPMLMSTGKSGATSGSDDMRGVFHTYRFTTDNTIIEMSRDAAAGVTLNPSYGGCIDWIGYSHPLADEKHLLNYAYPTKSLVRSVETFNYEGTSRLTQDYLTKGQLPENCVPFGSWRVGASDNDMDRVCRHAWIDKNSRLTVESDSSPVGNNMEQIWHVVEFDPEQVRVQQIYQCMTGTSYNVNIPLEVDLTKTFMWFTYNTDHNQHKWNYHLITGKFNSSTQLNFARTLSSSGVYLTIYLIECLQDQWYATHQVTGNDSDQNSYNSVYWNWIGGQRMIQGSYTIDNNSQYCSYSCYRLYPQGHYGYQWNRHNSTGNQTTRNLEVMEFNPTIGVRVSGQFLDFSSGQTSETKNVGFVGGVDSSERSMGLPTLVNCMNRSDATGTDDARGITIKLELTSDTTLTDERWDNGTNTYGYVQIIEWPPPKTHYFEGAVTERSVPIIRQVACFRSDTNEMMDSTVSASGTGLYHLQTTYSGTHYIVCQDDDLPIDYNHLVLGKMEPYPLPTFSGGEIIYG